MSYTSKEKALKDYKNAKIEYKKNMTPENWIKFCNARKKCMLLGVKI